jgi:hypothetical protein
MNKYSMNMVYEQKGMNILLNFLLLPKEGVPYTAYL